MVKELQPAATGRRGKRGNEVYSVHPTHPGVLIVRGLSSKKVSLKARQKQKAVEFGVIGYLGSTLIRAIRAGFPKNGMSLNGINQFIRVNKKKKVAEDVRINPNAPIDKNKKAPGEFTVIVHFDRLLVAQGRLEKATVIVEIDAERRSIGFTREAQKVEGARNRDSDRVHAVIYETTTGAVSSVNFTRGERAGLPPSPCPTDTGRRTSPSTFSPPRGKERQLPTRPASSFPSQKKGSGKKGCVTMTHPAPSRLNRVR